MYKHLLSDHKVTIKRPELFFIWKTILSTNYFMTLQETRKDRLVKKDFSKRLVKKKSSEVSVSYKKLSWNISQNSQNSARGGFQF